MDLNVLSNDDIDELTLILDGLDRLTDMIKSPHLLTSVSLCTGESLSRKQELPQSQRKSFLTVEECRGKRYNMEGIYNQFQQEGGRNACIPISLLTIFNINRNLSRGESFVMDEVQWNDLLSKAVGLYRTWVTDYEHGNKVNKSTVFPTIHEVLGCINNMGYLDQFVMTVGSTLQEMNGVIIDIDKSIISTSPSACNLIHLFEQMHYLMMGNHERNVVSALLIIPVHSCISIVYKRSYSSDTDSYSIIIFDSHGGLDTKLDSKKDDVSSSSSSSTSSKTSNSINCELTEFIDYQGAYAYIYSKYQLKDTYSTIKELGDVLQLTLEEQESALTFHSVLFYNRERSYLHNYGF